MITGAHAILYSDDADATRAALAKVLSTPPVDGGGWLLFAPATGRARRPPGHRGRPGRSPARSATRAGACSRPSPSPAGSSSASTSPATRPQHSDLSAVSA
jgi:hypothetical protein